MRCMRASISCWSWKTVSRARLVVARESATALRSQGSASDTGEDVLEGEERGEPGRLLETPAIERARILEEVHGTDRCVKETPAEEPTVECARDRFGDRHGQAADLADGDL